MASTLLCKSLTGSFTLTRKLGDFINIRNVFFIIAAMVASAQAYADGVQLYEKGELLIKLKEPATGKFASQVNAQNFFSAKAKKYHGLRVLHSFPEMSIHHLKVDESQGKSVEEVINELNGDDQVVYAEPNYIVQKAESQGYGAESYYSLAQVQAFHGVLTTANIDTSQAWAVESGGGSTVVVAVIDTGLDFTHPAFQNTVWTNPGEIANNGIDDDGNGYVDDVHGWNFAYGNNNPTDDEGHGTHVSGIVLGVGQNIFTSPVPRENVLIMPLKFLDSQGNGSNANAISAIYYAANMGARVMNNSWGGGSYSQALADAIGYAYQKNSLFVAAAGNSSTNNDSSPSYPASYNATNEVTVSATDSTDVIASFSNYGKSSVPLTAPGVTILSSYPVGQYAQMSGTSMASPMVAGTAALMIAQRPQMNFWQIKQLISSSADIKSNLASYVQTSGRVNVYNSVVSAQNAALSSYIPSYSSQGGGGSASSSGGCGLVSLVGKDRLKKGDPSNMAKEVVVVVALLILPVFLTIGLRRPEQAAQRRRYDRFAINSDVRFRVGDRELVGSVRSISMGGSDLNTEELLKDGSVITMSIASPDGKSQIQVQGHIVWNEQNKRYGVAFDSIADDLKSQIGQWTKGLQKAS